MNATTPTHPSAPDPAQDYLNRVLAEALTARASDLHFDPVEGGGGRVRRRADGVLSEVAPPPADLFAQVIGAVKAMCSLESGEPRVPQHGVILTEIAGHHLDLRISIMPTIYGERLVIRVLTREHVVMGLESLGFSDDDLAKVKSLCDAPHGLVICTGPTGSGKTTILYSILRSIDHDAKCIVTIEDPVEFALGGLAQTQIRPQTGLTFARALRAVLRQDPDVIMLGEIRDLETLQAMVTCALTGHLALTTLHVNTAPGAWRRMIDVGLEPYLANSSVIGIVASRLVRMLCPQCRQPAQPALHSLPRQALEFVTRQKDATFHAPRGCPNCSNTGYLGRTAIFEILTMDERIRQTVAAGADVAAIRSAAIASGMKPMLIDGLEKAARGITSIEELLRVLPITVNG